jgi:hypothetical protein
MNAAMYWKGMRTSIQLIMRSCKAGQINKRLNVKFGHLPPKTVISNPWECLCVNLIGSYTLKGRDNLQINFMALTMKDPASSWFKIVELPTDRNNLHENKHHIDYDYKVGDKVLIAKDGILCKAESKFGKETWTIMTVHMNGTIRVQCGTKSEWINIRRVMPFTDEIVL